MNRRNKILLAVLGVLLILLIVAFVFFPPAKIASNNEKEQQTVSEIMKSAGEEIITKENYEELPKRYADEGNNKDNIYYFLCACTTHIAKDGLAAGFNKSLTEEEKEAAVYANIYGKTMNQLIEEGKQIMKENNITLEEYKAKLENSTTNN